MSGVEGWVADAVESLQLPRRLRLRLTRKGLTVVPVTQARLTTQFRIFGQIEARLAGDR